MRVRYVNLGFILNKWLTVGVAPTSKSKYTSGFAERGKKKTKPVALTTIYLFNDQQTHSRFAFWHSRQKSSVPTTNRNDNSRLVRRACVTMYENKRIFYGLLRLHIAVERFTSRKSSGYSRLIFWRWRQSIKNSEVQLSPVKFSQRIAFNMVRHQLNLVQSTAELFSDTSEVSAFCKALVPNGPQEQSLALSLFAGVG